MRVFVQTLGVWLLGWYAGRAKLAFKWNRSNGIRKRRMVMRGSVLAVVVLVGALSTVEGQAQVVVYRTRGRYVVPAYVPAPRVVVRSVPTYVAPAYVSPHYIVPTPVRAAPIVVARPVLEAQAVYRAPVGSRVVVDRYIVQRPPIVVARPAIVAYGPGPVVVGRPDVIVRPKVYVRGQPIRNAFRAVTP